MFHNLLKKIYKYLRSVKLALLLLITLTIFTIIGMLLPQRNIYNSPVFIVISSVFLINLIACTIKQIEVYTKHWGKNRKISMQDINRLNNSFEVITKDKEVINKIVSLMKTKGFKVNISKGKLHGSKRKLGHLGSPLFHIGLVIVVIGVLISFTFKIQGRVNITEGQSFTGTRNEYLDFKKGIFAQEPIDVFRIGNEKVNVNINKNQFHFSSDIVMLDKNGTVLDKKAVKTNVNLKYRGYTFYPYDFGYSPAVIIEEKGNLIFSAYSQLETKQADDKINYAGTIKVDEKGWVIKTQFIPNIMKEGNPNQPLNPTLMLNFKDNLGNNLYEGSISMGQEKRVGDIVIKFPEYRYWIGFIVVNDPGVNLIFIGSIIALFGVVFLYFWVPKEIVVYYQNNPRNDETILKVGGYTKKYLYSFNEEFTIIKNDLLTILGG